MILLCSMTTRQTGTDPCFMNAACTTGNWYFVKMTGKATGSYGIGVGTQGGVGVERFTVDDNYDFFPGKAGE